MTGRSPANLPQTSDDPFQLDRLAEELVTREAAVSARQDGEFDTHDLPDFVSLSHDNPFLTSPDFNVEEFLLSRSNTSLSDLRMELREYLAQLKEELVKLINDDYEAFISLSTDLRDEGDRLARLKSPLGDLKSQILQSRSELQVIQNAIQEKLEKRAVLREEKALLHLLLKLSESVTRLESLLLIAPPENEATASLGANIARMPSHLTNIEDGAEDRSRGNRAKHLGRVAAEYTQLLYHASKARAQKCVFADEMQWRIDRIQSTISSDLDDVFGTTLLALTGGWGDGKVTEVEKNKSISDLTECLRTYDILGLWRDAEDVLKKEVVRKFVKKTIYPGALAAPPSPIVPHTPFPASKATSLSVATPMPPRTPYTPFSAFVFTTRNPSYPSGSSSASPYAHLLEDSDEPLAKLYSQALRFVERDLSTIMDIAEKVSVRSLHRPRPDKEVTIHASIRECLSDGKGFEIMANVIWEEFGRAIMDELGGTVFASGRPNEFRKHRELSQAFIRSLEFLAPSAHAIETMRRHPVYLAFEQRWQLPVYFQIRWKEIIGTLEELLAVARVEPSFAHDKNTFATPQANAVWVAITGCWSAEVFIPELCHKFWRLTLQILSWYKTWLDQALSKPDVISKASAGLASERAFANPSQSRSSTPSLTPEPSSAETTAVDDSILRQNVAVIVDVKAMRTNVLTIWREEISLMLPNAPDFAEDETDGTMAQEALNRVLSNLTSLIPSLSNEIITILTRRCCDALLPVRSIPSQFRAMSQKPSPTAPSYFISSVLRPLKSFFGIDGGGGPGVPLREEFLTPYATEIFDNVAQRYVYYLTAMKKTEESLRRLKRGKKTGFSLFGSANTAKDDDGKDEERIRLQMVHDVDAFGKDGESLGVALANSESYKALNDMVQALEAALDSS
ncbi:putative protein with domain of unknown function (DUF3510) [Lyophyllum shimeji]|uniref:Conserved oligomeric Golgi complex subunit 2 n=1 Tax=Lyophyllum shimeji TaxID=47721 RepID=A0A9P3PL54_LYOSH|nr:putative protein with domain of unknown function (DUF3510) [Lyophyllum shimeji]